MRPLDWLAGILLVIGGLNWGLVAIAEFDLVAWIVGLEFGAVNVASRLIYGVVALAAVYFAVRLPMILTGRQTIATRHELRPAA